MDQPWQQDDCEELKAMVKPFSIIEASLRWCGVPEEMLEEITREAKPKSDTGLGRAIWTHHAVPCLEARSALIARAIEVGELPQAREDGMPVSDHVAPTRRHVIGETLRNWITENYPNQRPEFLFPEGEEGTVSAPPKKNKRSEDELTLKSENSYLMIIGALLDAIKGDVPQLGNPPVFESEAELITKLVSRYTGIQGLSKRNLEEKFARAKEAIDS